MEDSAWTKTFFFLFLCFSSFCYSCVAQELRDFLSAVLIQDAELQITNNIPGNVNLQFSPNNDNRIIVSVYVSNQAVQTQFYTQNNVIYLTVDAGNLTATTYNPSRSTADLSTSTSTGLAPVQFLVLPLGTRSLAALQLHFRLLPCYHRLLCPQLPHLQQVMTVVSHLTDFQ
jgi:hypothetical protein